MVGCIVVDPEAEPDGPDPEPEPVADARAEPGAEIEPGPEPGAKAELLPAAELADVCCGATIVVVVSTAEEEAGDEAEAEAEAEGEETDACNILATVHTQREIVGRIRKWAGPYSQSSNCHCCRTW